MVSSAMVIHYIDDMDAAIAFYRDGLGLTVATQSPGWSTLGVTESLELGLHTRGEGHPGPPAAHPFDAFATTLVLNVDDLDACCARIRQRQGTVDRIVEPHDGIPVRMGLVRDPAGNGFQVNQHVG